MTLGFSWVNEAGLEVMGRPLIAILLLRGWKIGLVLIPCRPLWKSELFFGKFRPLD